MPRVGSTPTRSYCATRAIPASSRRATWATRPHDIRRDRGSARGEARYGGYGSCPFAVELGEIVLAEFPGGGKGAPTFPRWLIDGTRRAQAGMTP
jgi:sulfide:quinone oxidoreductase